LHLRALTMVHLHTAYTRHCPNGGLPMPPCLSGLSMRNSTPTSSSRHGRRHKYTIGERWIWRELGRGEAGGSAGKQNHAGVTGDPVERLGMKLFVLSGRFIGQKCFWHPGPCPKVAAEGSKPLSVQCPTPLAEGAFKKEV